MLAFIVAVIALKLWLLTIVATVGEQDAHNPEEQNSTTEDGTHESDHGQPIALTAPTPNSGWHTEEKQHRRHERRYWRFSLMISGFAMFAATGAGVAAYFAYQESGRQADAAEKNIPRSWLYVELPNKAEHPVSGGGLCSPRDHSESTFAPFDCIEKMDQKSGTRSYSVEFTFKLRNYGNIPSTVTAIRVYVFHTIDPNRTSSFSEAPFSRNGLSHGIYCAAATARESDTIPGAIIGSNNSIISPPYVAHIPPYRTPGESFGFFPNWIWIVVRYRDPYGTGRETGYMAKITTFAITSVANSRYTYNDGHPSYALSGECPQW